MSKKDDGKDDGKNEHERKKRVHTNLDYYNSLYQRKRPKLPLSTQEFRFSVLRPDHDDRVNLGGILESAEWRDEGTFSNLNAIPVLRGQVVLRKPNLSDPLNALDIHDGHVIKCQVNWGGRWKELWRMRIIRSTLSIADGTWTLELADDLQLISKSTYDYKFVK